jgi:hypothetical protein
MNVKKAIIYVLPTPSIRVYFFCNDCELEYGERRFSGEKDPVGSRVLAAIARILSSLSFSLSFSGDESLELLNGFPGALSLVLQSPLLRTPSFGRRNAGGLQLLLEADFVLSKGGLQLLLEVDSVSKSESSK